MSYINEIKNAYDMFFCDVIKIHKLDERREQERTRNSRVSSFLRVADWLDPVFCFVAISAFVLTSVLPMAFGAMFLLLGNANAWELVRRGVLPGIIFALSLAAWELIKRMGSRFTSVAHDQAGNLLNHANSLDKKCFERFLCELKLAEATDEFMEERIRVVSVGQGKLFIDEDLSYNSNIAITLDLSSMYSLKECSEQGDMELIFKSRHLDAFKTVFSGSETTIHQVVIEGLMCVFLCATSPEYQACVFLKQEKDGSFVDIVSCY